MNVPELFKEQNLHIQELSYSCGPCSILNVLQAQGDFSQNEQGLTELCQAKPGTGTENPAMISAAKAVGLEVVEAKADATLEDLRAHLDAGHYIIICYWHAFNGDGHYSVISDYDDRSVYVIDCSLGFLRLLNEDLLKHWHNTDGTIQRWLMAVK